ncbi:hypothetical protein J2Z44_002659 [Clostridium punense]|uniref:Uncharacterized protein n=1 Tax=Clostridium punense TaxID=1054297 RepID=A0ABS4K884_9CLOT|nr:hypothetical protein M918_15855 [Clostridium sp. BL8]MBP2022834.1 hypothetical protein [Clostridium punense]
MNYLIKSISSKQVNMFSVYINLICKFEARGES